MRPKTTHEKKYPEKYVSIKSTPVKDWGLNPFSTRIGGIYQPEYVTIGTTTAVSASTIPVYQNGTYKWTTIEPGVQVLET